MDADIAALSAAAGFRQAYPDYQIQDRLGNKLFLPELSQRLGLPIISSIIFPNPGIRAVDAAAQCIKAFGFPYIIQGWVATLGMPRF